MYVRLFVTVETEARVVTVQLHPPSSLKSRCKGEHNCLRSASILSLNLYLSTPKYALIRYVSKLYN